MEKMPILPIFLYGCEIRSWSALETRLGMCEVSLVPRPHSPGEEGSGYNTTSRPTQ